MQNTLHNKPMRTAVDLLLAPKVFYFCYYAAMAAFSPYLALYYRQLGIGETQIGLLAGIPPLVGLIAAPLWGGFADATQKHHRLLQIAISGLWGVVLIFLLIRNPLWLLPLVILYACFSAPIMPLVDNSVLLLLGDRREAYGRQRLWGAVGWGVAGTLLGLLLDRVGLHWAFYGALLFLGGCWLAARQLAVQPVQIGQPFWRGMRFFVSSWPWLVFLITLFINGLASGVSNSFLFLYLDQLGASRTLMGFSLLIATLSELPIFFFGERLLQRLGARGLLLVALVATVLRMIAYALMPSAVYVLPINLLHGFPFSAMWIAAVSYANRAAPPGMGATAQGLLSGISMGLAGSIGALLGGYLYETIGPAATFGCAGGAVLVGLIFFALMGRRARDIGATASTAH